MAGPAADFLALLLTLATHRVETIVVGGVCAVLHGAPVTTFDLDVVHRRSAENLERLSAALRDLGAHYRGRGEQRLMPEAAHLASPGHHLLMTTAGPLDLLGTVGAGRDFDALVDHTSVVELDELEVRILDLPTLIQVKEESARDKDLFSARLLRRLLEEGGEG